MMFEQERRERLRSPEQRVGTLPNGNLPPPAANEMEDLLARALLERDEKAFGIVLDRLFSSMMQTARSHVRSRAEAEEIVQDTWLAALRGVDRFQGRSTLRTWLFRILRNRARTHGARAARTIAFTDLEAARGGAEGDDGPAFDIADRGGWAATSDPDRMPEAEAALLARELRQRIEGAIEVLPPRQRDVVTLRDVDGWSSAEVCEALDLSDANQRVLLHRARSTLRRRLSGYVDGRDEGIALAATG